jgi:hypothetical protein
MRRNRNSEICKGGNGATILNTKTKDKIMIDPLQHDKKKLNEDAQNARYRMRQESPGSDKWWVAYYDLRKAESFLG